MIRIVTPIAFISRISRAILSNESPPLSLRMDGAASRFDKLSDHGCQSAIAKAC